ncbi:hypothetical protein [Embleya sp. NPDC020886]|uniref:hypothetical protein n=1 Tax=Embleya sp. NPDC020886 TaxID=3363980 RepID=UPI0037AADD3D
MLNSMPDPVPIPDTARADMAARLDRLIGIPVDLYDGIPGATSGRARSLLDIAPHIAARARALMDTVLPGATPGMDTTLLIVSAPEWAADALDRTA